MERVERFVDAAALVCRRACALGVETTILFLHSEAGPPVITVANGADGNPSWIASPVFLMLRERLEMIGSEVFDLRRRRPLADRLGYTGPPICAFVVPLLGPGGWFATLVHGNATPLGIELERRLALQSTELCVWCTEHGIGRVPSRHGLGDLPARRFRIAQLAAQGLTNAEIAQVLDISINTVKSRLKQAFAQLHVDNRTELASVLRRLAPVREVPLGVTRMDDVTITRVEHPIGYSAGRERSATSEA